MNISMFFLIILAPIYFIIAALYRFYISRRVSDKKKWKSKEIAVGIIFICFFVALLILNFLFYSLERPYLLWIIVCSYAVSLILVLRNLIFMLINKSPLNKIIRYNRQIIVIYLILAIISSIAAIFF